QEPESDAAPPDDAGSGQGGDGQAPPPDDVWAGCPAADSVEQDAQWPLTMEVTEDAVYCATYNETRTLQEELAAKLQLRITPCSYRVPATATADWTLPACIKGATGEPLAVTAGQTEYSSSAFDDSISHTLAAQATFAPSGPQLLR